MKIYAAISLVQRDLAKIGISKNHTNSQGSGYKFRGIDDVYNAIAPLLYLHGLCILPRMISRIATERTSAKGSQLFYVTVEAEFDFVAVEDGSKHVVRTFGEAMDSGDKATNKAMSAAYKYACFQAFAIPVDGNDSEKDSYEVKKNKIDNNRLSKAIEQIKLGNYTTDKLRRDFDLTDQQEEILVGALANG